MHRDESIVQGRLVAFVRISSSNSEIDSQKEMVARLAGRVGGFIRHWYEDPDRPRWKAEHSTVLKRLMEDAAERRFDWVILDKQQRLGTIDHMELFSYLHGFRMAGVRVWSVQEGELTSNEIATSFRQVASAQSEIEDQKNKAGNVVRGMFLNARRFRFNGAILPYGYDRVCVSPEGTERFRLVEENRTENPGHVRGSKAPEHTRFICHYTVLYPNGHEEKLTQLPGKGKHDWYEYAVSVRRERVETVQLVYRMYVEGFNRTEIARHLNKLGVDRGFRQYWHTDHIDGILDHPIYGGVHEWKKLSQAAYKTISKDGSYVDAIWSKADPRSRRKVIPAEDRVQAEAVREELRVVEQELIVRARARLKADRAAPRLQRQRSDGYWLRPFLVCGHCGGPMRGQTVHVGKQSGKEYVNSYFRCSSYSLKQEVGAPSSCVNNRVRRDVVEAKLAEFLTQFGRRLEFDLGGGAAKVSHLLLPFREKESATAAIRREMVENVRERMTPDQFDMIGLDGGPTLVDAYRHYFDKEVASIQAEIAAIEDRIGEFALARVGLTRGGVADTKLVAKIHELEGEAERTRASIVPLDRRLDAIARELAEICASIEAVANHSRDRQTRQAADALKKVLMRAEVFSVESGHAKRPAYRWLADRLVFHPVIGDPMEFRLPWPDHLLRPEAVARARELLAEQVAAGRVSLAAIATRLQAEGYPTVSGKPWTRSALVKPLAGLVPLTNDAPTRTRRKAGSGPGGER